MCPAVLLFNTVLQRTIIEVMKEHYFLLQNYTPQWENRVFNHLLEGEKKIVTVNTFSSKLVLICNVFINSLSFLERLPPFTFLAFHRCFYPK